MNISELEEIYAWAVEKRVLHVSYDGITLTLDPSALPVVLMERPPEAKDVGYDEDDDRLTPQEKLRREYDREQNVDAERGA